MAAATVTERVTTLVAQVGGLTILAATLAAVVAGLYRWYVRETVPRGLSLLVGLSGVAAYLNTSRVIGQVIAGSTAPTNTEQAIFNIGAFAIAAGGAAVGRRIGDQFGADVLLDGGFTDVDGDVGRLVQSVGRVTAVTLPQQLEDVLGYDPIAEETKSKLAGRTFLFPKRLTVAELRERLVHRLKTDYAIGHVDVELADDGSIAYLALGSRAAGIGPTLPPATNAVAVRADPAFAASAGDLVQVWETAPMRRVLTAELRGVADETVTLAIDAADTPKIDSTTEYRLVTLPVTDRPDREFASLLRAADETFSSVTVKAGSPLHGLPVGALELAVVAVKAEDTPVATLPEPSSLLAPGDVVSVIARPEALRRLERAAKRLDPSVVSQAPPTRPRGDSGQPTPSRPEQATAEGADEPQPGTNPRPRTEPGDDEPEHADTTGTQPPTGSETRDVAGDNVDEAQRGDDTTGGQAGAESFQDLTEEFESGEADWADSDDQSGNDTGTTGGNGADDDAVDDSDDLFGENAGLEDVTFDTDSDASAEPAEDPGLDDISFDDDPDDETDDLAALGGDSTSDDELTLDDDADGTDGDDEEDDDEDDDDDGGGATSFQQLKEEFESGDADWEDEVSDSPGGDMRLDE